MAKKVKEYRRLPGRSGSLVGYCTLWLGADHVLSRTQTSFSERYKRFYFRDIQAIITRKTDRRMVWNIILGALTALFTLIAMEPNEVALMIGGICAAIFFCSFLINWLRGPTCVTHLRTAVQTEKLSSLNRIRTASKVISILRPRIEEVQGRLTGEEIQAKAAAMTAAPAPHREDIVATPKVDQRAKQYSGRAHEILFYLLLLNGSLFCVRIFHNHIAITLGLNVVFLALGVFVVLALIKQHDTHLRDDVRWLTWGTLGYVFVSLYLSLTYVKVITITKSDPVMNTWEMMKELSAISYLDSPFLLAFSIFSLVCSLSLGMCGIWFLAKSRRTWMPPHPRSVLYRG